MLKQYLSLGYFRQCALDPVTSGFRVLHVLLRYRGPLLHTPDPPVHEQWED